MNDWESKLKQLGWKFLKKKCGMCGTYIWIRGKTQMTVKPGRDFYIFREDGKNFSGKLSQLDSVIKAAKG